MLTKEFYKGAQHNWYVFGRDPAKPDKIIDTNQYMVTTANNALLMDPGGIELFSAMLANVVRLVPVQQVKHIFSSHQDPDIISSLGLWDRALENATLHAPWLWEGFLRHFGISNIEYDAIPDQGSSLTLGSIELQFIPAHYLHSSANFHVYDPKAKVLMSGDVGAALEPAGMSIFVEDFDEHKKNMTLFHQRWMPSNRAKNNWVERVSKLEIDFMCPQHGRIFSGDNVKKFLEWFYQLEVACAI